MENNSKKTDVDYARQLQEKFEFYVLGLIFTLLALAIQTAKFGVSDWADVFELLGWLFLFISGLTGLSRVEWMPVTFKTHSQLLAIKAELQMLEELKSKGVEDVLFDKLEQSVKIDSVMPEISSKATKLGEQVKSLERGILIKYMVHKWLFVSALLFLIVARSFVPIIELAKKHVIG